MKPSLRHRFNAILQSWETQSLVDAFFYKPVDAVFLRAFLKTSIRANQVSALSGLVGFLAACFYLDFRRAPIALGGVLLCLSNVLDGVDGQLARARNESSQTGKLLDNLFDPMKTTFLLLFMAIGMDLAGTWGSLPTIPRVPTFVQYYGLCALTGAVFLYQILHRNELVELYRRHARGTSDPNFARIAVVREELEAMRAQGGHRLERIFVPLGLFFARPSGVAPAPLPAPSASYAAALRPYMRAWTFFAGGPQFTVIVLASLFGEPTWGLVLILASFAIAWPLRNATVRAHRKALAEESRSAAPK